MSISNFEKIWNISIRITDTDKSRSDGCRITEVSQDYNEGTYDAA